MYETPSHNKQHNNQDIGTPDHHAHLEDIKTLHIQLFHSLGNSILLSNQDMMMVQPLWI